MEIKNKDEEEEVEEEEGQAPTEPTKDEETRPEKKETAISVAKKLADRIDAGNAKTEELVKRQEALAAQNMLGGQSNAGQAPPKKESEDEKWEREAKVRYEGTGLDPTPSGDESGF